MEHRKDYVHFSFTFPSDATYYVDANGGSVKDAIEVVCRKLEQYEGWFTCVKPSTIEMVKTL